MTLWSYLYRQLGQILHLNEFFPVGVILKTSSYCYSELCNSESIITLTKKYAYKPFSSEFYFFQLLIQNFLPKSYHKNFERHFLRWRSCEVTN